MKNIIKFCAGLSILGLTACTTTEPSEPVREVVVQEEIIIMPPESAVHSEHHKKHHKKHPHAAATHKDAGQQTAPHKNKAVHDMQMQMQNQKPSQNSAPTKAAPESK